MKYVGIIQKYRVPSLPVLDNVTFGGMSVRPEKILTSPLIYKLWWRHIQGNYRGTWKSFELSPYFFIFLEFSIPKNLNRERGWEPITCMEGKFSVPWSMYRGTYFFIFPTYFFIFKISDTILASHHRPSSQDAVQRCMSGWQSTHPEGKRRFLWQASDVTRRDWEKF